MPAYDFRCLECGDVTEVTRPSSDTSPVPCCSCGSATKRVFSPVGIHFKGSGFHNTDYKKDGSKPAADPKPADAPSCPSKDAGSPKCSGCPAAEGGAA